MCDNCTDGTAAVAERLGWEVWHSDDNRHKKAGALNQAWERLAGDLRDEDFLIVMVADSHLDEHFVEAALAEHAEDAYGTFDYLPRTKSGACDSRRLGVGERRAGRVTWEQQSIEGTGAVVRALARGSGRLGDRAGSGTRGLLQGHRQLRA